MPKANVSTALFVLEILLAALQQKLVNSKQKGDRGLLPLELGGLNRAGGMASSAPVGTSHLGDQM